MQAEEQVKIEFCFNQFKVINLSEKCAVRGSIGLPIGAVEQR